MRPHYFVILNPTARYGWAGRQRRRLEHALDEAGLSYEVHLTGYRRHAVELASRGAETADVVVAAGGDGTVQEVCRGLLATGGLASLGIVPLGTGNDFVKMVGVPRDVEEAVRVLAAARRRPMDYGRFQWWGEQEVPAGEGLFVNAIGMGFDACVAVAAERFKALPGPAAYAAGVLHSLRRYRAPHCRAEAGDGSILYEGPLFLVTAANGVCSGGAFYLTPDASAADGLLDVCLVEDVELRRVLRLVPRVMRGRHVGEPEVHLRRVRRLTVVAEVPLPVHVDGESVTTEARRLVAEVIPGGLTVVHPWQ